VGEWLKPVPC